MRTKEIIVRNSEAVQKLAARLITRSVYFSFTPLPDDDYAIEVKIEDVPLVEGELKNL